MTTVAARIFQLKKNSAAIAPTWRNAITMVTGQFVFCWLNIRIWVTALSRSLAFGRSVSTLSGISGSICKSCVISILIPHGLSQRYTCWSYTAGIPPRWTRLARPLLIQTENEEGAPGCDGHVLPAFAHVRDWVCIDRPPGLQDR